MRCQCLHLPNPFCSASVHAHGLVNDHMVIQEGVKGFFKKFKCVVDTKDNCQGVLLRT